jgi:signal transduction histidine kinase
MLPKIVTHKKNGHHHAPAKHAPSVGDILRQVHGGGNQGPRPTYDLLKFATVVRTEKRTALLEQAVRHVDGLHSGLNGLLARTEAAFARGELHEVRSTLESLRTQAGEATRLFARLLAGAETRTSEHGLVAINELVAHAAERAGAVADAPVAAHLDPSAPSIIGNVARLERALVTLAAALRGSRPLSIRAAQVDGVIQGETIVRITVSGDSPLPPAAAALGGRAPLAEPAAEALDVHLARQIVAEHGGAVSLVPDADGGSAILIELPAV